MYKEKLQELITENFLNDEIEIDTYISESENIKNISEKDAKEFLSEVDIGGIAAGIGLGIVTAGTIF